MQSVLVVGAGTMGKTHIRAYQKMDNVTIVGIVDIRKREMLGVVNEEIPVFASIEEATGQLEHIDVIDICLPTYLHSKYVKRAAELGKQIICEKPIARTLVEAKEMIDICKANGVKLFIGHVVRFFPEYQEAKKSIDSGAIGNPGVLRTTRNSSFPHAWNDWYSSHKNSGGLILDLIIHDFDFLRWCFGDVERVYAKSLIGREYAKKEYALVTLRFKSGAIAHVEGSWSHETFSTKFEFAGDEGMIEFDSMKDHSLEAVVSNRHGGAGGVAVPSKPLKENAYFRELAHFIDCIENDKEAIITPDDAYKAVEIATAVLQSIETKQPVLIHT